MTPKSHNADDLNRSSTSLASSLTVTRRYALAHSLALATLVIVAVDPALADSHNATAIGTAFCTSSMATTIRNLFTVIQFGGPLIGGVLALGATVAIPTIRRADMKKELKEVRNQGVIWGVIVAPLATTILGFILNNVVAGGTSCGF